MAAKRKPAFESTGKSFPHYIGGWFSPRRKGFKAACCDCGLVHVFRFRLVPNHHGPGTKIEMEVDRDNRATGMMRRRMRKAQ